MPIDYSRWKQIDVSDDEDDTHPNIDTPSLFRWRHQARVEKMEEKKKEKNKLLEFKKSNQQKIAEIRKKLEEATLSDNEKSVLNVELEELRKQEDEYRKKEEELDRKERLEPWNVDTISHDGFSKSRINKVEKAKPAPMTEEEKSEKMKEFFETNESLIKEFAFLKKFDDSKQFLLEHPELCSEFTADYLTIHCLNLEIEEKKDLMEHVAHQVIVMQYLVELAKQLDVNPKAPQLVSNFFTKIKQADPQYLQMFEDELRQFKERIRKRGNEKREEAMREAEAELEKERQERIKDSPGGLDPMEVFESLPKAMQECFENQDIGMLQQVAQSMSQEEFRGHLDRCVKSGLWVPDGGAKGDSEMADAVQDGKENDGTELRKRKK